MDEIQDIAGPALTQAKDSAAMVLSQLVEQLVKHYKISKSEARMTIREVLMEL
jgi:polyhydroxyalkanoate synthesis regulator phasin